MRSVGWGRWGGQCNGRQFLYFALCFLLTGAFEEFKEIRRVLEIIIPPDASAKYLERPNYNAINLRCLTIRFGHLSQSFISVSRPTFQKVPSWKTCHSRNLPFVMSQRVTDVFPRLARTVSLLFLKQPPGVLWAEETEIRRHSRLSCLTRGLMWSNQTCWQRRNRHVMTHRLR